MDAFVSCLLLHSLFHSYHLSLILPTSPNCSLYHRHDIPQPISKLLPRPQPPRLHPPQQPALPLAARTSPPPRPLHPRHPSRRLNRRCGDRNRSMASRNRSNIPRYLMHRFGYQHRSNTAKTIASLIRQFHHIGRAASTTHGAAPQIRRCAYLASVPCA